MKIQLLSVFESFQSLSLSLSPVSALALPYFLPPFYRERVGKLYACVNRMMVMKVEGRNGVRARVPPKRKVIATEQQSASLLSTTKHLPRSRLLSVCPSLSTHSLAHSLTHCFIQSAAFSSLPCPPPPKPPVLSSSYWPIQSCVVDHTTQAIVGSYVQAFHPCCCAVSERNASPGPCTPTPNRTIWALIK